MAARGPKMADGVWKCVYPLVFGHSRQLSQNKFFDSSTPSMRKGDDGEKKKKKIKTFLMATNVVASRPTATPTAFAKRKKITKRITGA